MKQTKSNLLFIVRLNCVFVFINIHIYENEMNKYLFSSFSLPSITETTTTSRLCAVAVTYTSLSLCRYFVSIYDKITNIL